MTIIGISGPIGSGKSTVARSIEKSSKRPVYIVPFANPLKEFALRLGWNGKKDKKGRRLLQLLGNECGRECIDPNLWTKKWSKYIENMNRDDCIIIADDVRFRNEALLIKKLGGYLFKIKNRGEYSSHPSEHELDDALFNHIIKNNSTLESLQSTMESIKW